MRERRGGGCRGRAVAQPPTSRALEAVTWRFGGVASADCRCSAAPLLCVTFAVHCRWRFGSSPFCFFTGPWTVTRSSLRVLRRVVAF